MKSLSEMAKQDERQKERGSRSGRVKAVMRNKGGKRQREKTKKGEGGMGVSGEKSEQTKGEGEREMKWE